MRFFANIFLAAWVVSAVAAVHFPKPRIAVAPKKKEDEAPAKVELVGGSGKSHKLFLTEEETDLSVEVEEPPKAAEEALQKLLLTKLHDSGSHRHLRGNHRKLAPLDKGFLSDVIAPSSFRQLKKKDPEFHHPSNHGRRLDESPLCSRQSDGSVACVPPDPCEGKRNALNSCGPSSTVDACINCVDDGFESSGFPFSSCDENEEEICRILNNCDSVCGPCEDEIEELFECLAIDPGECGGLNCDDHEPEPDPDPPQHCEAELNALISCGASNTRNACVNCINAFFENLDAPGSSCDEAEADFCRIRNACEVCLSCGDEVEELVECWWIIDPGECRGFTCSDSPTTPPTTEPPIDTAPPTDPPTQAKVCTLRNDVDWCTNPNDEINLGTGLSGSECRDQCEVAMSSDGCWVLAENGICYCREGGELGTGGPEGVNPGGLCTDPPTTPPTTEPPIDTAPPTDPPTNPPTTEPPIDTAPPEPTDPPDSGSVSVAFGALFPAIVIGMATQVIF